ncbi:hypothetical protein SLA2020_284320 [Shorea laevis]
MVFPSASRVTDGHLFHHVSHLAHRVFRPGGCGSQFGLFQRPIYFSLSLLACHAPAHHLSRLSSFPSMAATHPTDVHAPIRGLHALVR